MTNDEDDNLNNSAPCQLDFVSVYQATHQPMTEGVTANEDEDGACNEVTYVGISTDSFLRQMISWDATGLQI